MKLTPLLVGCAAVAVLSQTALGWTNEDHEIFDIVSALETAEGKGTTFYSFLNVTKAATEKEISKSYKKRSLELHPDKNPDNKHIADRFARLGTIAGILRDDEKRKRYDHFYENGVPRWRGTGYYYSRYRPGLVTVLVALTIFSCFIQYVYLLLQWGVSIQRIRAFQDQAREWAKKAATGRSGTGRKSFKAKTGDQPGPAIPGIAGGRPTKPGQTLDMVVDGEKVYIVENGIETLLDDDSADFPSIWQTWIPQIAYRNFLRVTGRPLPGEAINSDEETEEVVDAKGKPVVVRKPRGPAKGIEGTGKVGGRRRVVKPKRVEA